MQQAQQDKNPDAARQRLDQDLGVAEWYVPGGVYMEHRREEGAPAWWRGEEDASASFLAQMGVQLEEGSSG